MQKQTIAMILQFLERTSIAGREVQAFMQCVKELNAEMAKPEPSVKENTQAP